MSRLHEKVFAQKISERECTYGKKFGDRKDGAKLRNIHAMHLVMPLMYPNRCDNEAFISERIDLTNVLAYLDEKNASDPDYRYNFFQVMVTTMLKVITLRPKMNRFIANKTMYQRNEVSAAFTVKRNLPTTAARRWPISTPGAPTPSTPFMTKFSVRSPSAAAATRWIKAPRA